MEARKEQVNKLATSVGKVGNVFVVASECLGLWVAYKA